MTTLRDQQRRLARDRIMTALAEEIAAHGLAELAVPAVAKRAGVSVRTVYNHFENKDVLVASLNPWVEEQMAALGGVLVETVPDRIPDAIRINFRLFSELGPISEALARIEAAASDESILTETNRRLRAQRNEAMRSLVADERPDLAPDQAAALTAMLRSVMSFATWDRLARDYGLTGEEAGEQAAWAFSLLLEALRDRRTPFDGAPGH